MSPHLVYAVLWIKSGAVDMLSYHFSNSAISSAQFSQLVFPKETLVRSRGLAGYERFLSLLIAEAHMMAALNDSYENGFVHSICSATLRDPLIPSDFAQPGTNCLAVTLTI